MEPDKIVAFDFTSDEKQKQSNAVFLSIYPAFYDERGVTSKEERHEIGCTQMKIVRDGTNVKGRANFRGLDSPKPIMFDGEERVLQMTFFVEFGTKAHQTVMVSCVREKEILPTLNMTKVQSQYIKAKMHSLVKSEETSFEYELELYKHKSIWILKSISFEIPHTVWKEIAQDTLGIWKMKKAKDKSFIMLDQ